jgi:hypothetical protein
VSDRALQGDLLAPHRLGARQNWKSRLARLVTFTAILGIHLLWVLCFPTLRRPFFHMPGDELTTTIAFLEPMQPQPSAQTVKLRARSPTKREPARKNVRGAALPETSEATEQENTAPIAIDWAKEAERAAAHRIEADEEAGRRTSALSPRRGPRLGAPEAPAALPQFGWDHAHIHRVEPIPDGGLVVNLNDRCAIVVEFPFLLPGCKIGKIRSRGDLFTHMNDPPTLGDWKDH